MKKTDRKSMVARAQMEFPFEKRFGGSLSGGYIDRPKKATKLVADWWFNRMRFDLGGETQLSIRKA
ncbi:MAG: hypothetical protein CMO77_03410 [Verrucomicrobiales bacterium]|jgi:hypothetical protein|nr:hypothetical protein [Verrucomicrobiales bacterium]MEC7883566.1 hypothetical protein [Verrucomicrobiota bacterium]|tara:strand:+ start:531 stop:728 length:198 start_codon:yes stop_codon:yes gene_type:complete